MDDDQSMRDRVADGAGPGEQATELGPQADGAGRVGQGPASTDEAALGQAAQDEAGPIRSMRTEPSQGQARRRPPVRPISPTKPIRPVRPGLSGARSGVELAVLIVVALAIALVIKTFVVQAVLHPVVLDGRHAADRRQGPGQQARVPPAADPAGRHHRVRRRGLVGPAAARPAQASSDPVVRAYDDTLRPLFRSIGGLFGTAPGQTDYIKRVIGVPGDHVACCNAQGLVTVNGVPLHEKSYLYPGAAPSEIRFSVTVPARPPVGDGRQPARSPTTPGCTAPIRATARSRRTRSSGGPS